MCFKTILVDKNKGRSNRSFRKCNIYKTKKVYKVAVRPAMLYGLETVALTKRQEVEMEVAELKMLRFSLGEWTRSGMSTSEGQHRWDGLERNTRGKTDVVWTCREER